MSAFSIRELFSISTTTSETELREMLFANIGGVRELNTFLPDKLPLATPQGEARDPRDLIGQSFGLSTVRDVIASPGELTIIIETKNTLVNDARTEEIASFEDDKYNLRVLESRKFRLCFDIRNGNLSNMRFDMYRHDHLGDYGHNGYYHMGGEACLGSYREGIQNICINPDLPVGMLFHVINEFLVHRNERDVAGEWYKFKAKLSTRKIIIKDKPLIKFYEGLQKVEYLYSWGEFNNDYLSKQTALYAKDAGLSEEEMENISWILPEIESSTTKKGLRKVLPF